jgi:endonuclease/exonuclease/phosphatase family metal-dependent hydrolase
MEGGSFNIVQFNMGADERDYIQLLGKEVTRNHLTPRFKSQIIQVYDRCKYQQAKDLAEVADVLTLQEIRSDDGNNELGIQALREKGFQIIQRMRQNGQPEVEMRVAIAINPKKFSSIDNRSLHYSTGQAHPVHVAIATAIEIATGKRVAFISMHASGFSLETTKNEEGVPVLGENAISLADDGDQSVLETIYAIQETCKDCENIIMGADMNAFPEIYKKRFDMFTDAGFTIHRTDKATNQLSRFGEFEVQTGARELDYVFTSTKVPSNKVGSKLMNFMRNLFRKETIHIKHEAIIAPDSNGNEYKLDPISSSSDHLPVLVKISHVFKKSLLHRFASFITSMFKSSPTPNSEVRLKEIYKGILQDVASGKAMVGTKIAREAYEKATITQQEFMKSFPLVLNSIQDLINTNQDIANPFNSPLDDDSFIIFFAKAQAALQEGNFENFLLNEPEAKNPHKITHLLETLVSKLDPPISKQDIRAIGFNPFQQHLASLFTLLANVEGKIKTNQTIPQLSVAPIIERMFTQEAVPTVSSIVLQKSAEAVTNTLKQSVDLKWEELNQRITLLENAIKGIEKPEKEDNTGNNVYQAAVKSIVEARDIFERQLPPIERAKNIAQQATSLSGEISSLKESAVQEVGKRHDWDYKKTKDDPRLPLNHMKSELDSLKENINKLREVAPSPELEQAIAEAELSLKITHTNYLKAEFEVMQDLFTFGKNFSIDELKRIQESIESELKQPLADLNINKKELVKAIDLARIAAQNTIAGIIKIYPKVLFETHSLALNRIIQDPTRDHSENIAAMERDIATVNQLINQPNPPEFIRATLHRCDAGLEQFEKTLEIYKEIGKNFQEFFKVDIKNFSTAEDSITLLKKADKLARTPLTQGDSWGQASDAVIKQGQSACLHLSDLNEIGQSIKQPVKFFEIENKAVYQSHLESIEWFRKYAIGIPEEVSRAVATNQCNKLFAHVSDTYLSNQMQLFNPETIKSLTPKECVKWSEQFIEVQKLITDPGYSYDSRMKETYSNYCNECIQKWLLSEGEGVERNLYTEGLSRDSNLSEKFARVSMAAQMKVYLLEVEKALKKDPLTAPEQLNIEGKRDDKIAMIVNEEIEKMHGAAIENYVQTLEGKKRDTWSQFQTFVGNDFPTPIEIKLAALVYIQSSERHVFENMIKSAMKAKSEQNGMIENFEYKSSECFSQLFSMLNEKSDNDVIKSHLDLAKFLSYRAGFNQNPQFITDTLAYDVMRAFEPDENRMYFNEKVERHNDSKVRFPDSASEKQKELAQKGYVQLIKPFLHNSSWKFDKENQILYWEGGLGLRTGESKTSDRVDIDLRFLHMGGDIKKQKAIAKLIEDTFTLEPLEFNNYKKATDLPIAYQAAFPSTDPEFTQIYSQFMESVTRLHKNIDAAICKMCKPT